MRDSKSTEPKSSGSESIDELNAEIERLRARLHQLGADEPHAPSGTHRKEREPDREAADVLRDLPERALDEGSKLIRSLTLAAVEPLRLVGDLARNLGDEVLLRNRPGNTGSRDEPPTGQRSSPASLTSALPKDLSAGLIRALDLSLEIPGRVVGRFCDVYRETDSLQRTSVEREISRADRALTRAERLAKLRREENVRQEQKHSPKSAHQTEPPPEA